MTAVSSAIIVRADLRHPVTGVQSEVLVSSAGTLLCTNTRRYTRTHNEPHNRKGGANEQNGKNNLELYKAEMDTLDVRDGHPDACSVVPGQAKIVQTR